MNDNELQFIFAVIPESKKNVVSSRQVFWLVRFSVPSHSEKPEQWYLSQKP